MAAPESERDRSQSQEMGQEPQSPYAHLKANTNPGEHSQKKYQQGNQSWEGNEKLNPAKAWYGSLHRDSGNQRWHSNEASDRAKASYGSLNADAFSLLMGPRGDYRHETRELSPSPAKVAIEERSIESKLSRRKNNMNTGNNKSEVTKTSDDKDAGTGPTLRVENVATGNDLYKFLDNYAFFSRSVQMSNHRVKMIAQAIQNSPADCIQFRTSVRVGPVDWLKGLAEAVTRQRWHWWPLADRIWPIRPGYQRLTLRSPAGLLKELDFPQELYPHFHELMLSAAYDVPMVPVGSRNHTHPSSGVSIGAGHVQTDFSAVIPLPAPVLLYGSNANIPPIGAQPAQIDTAGPLHVYLGVRHRKGCKFRHIVLTRTTDDLAFFLALKAEYRKMRGWLQRAFSPWQYEYCDFFEYLKSAVRSDSGTAIRHSYPLTQLEYSMDPCPVVKDPPIGSGDFSDYFYHVNDSMWSEVLRGSKEAILVLPKKKQELVWRDGKYDTFWGLYAVEIPCFIRVMAGFALCLAPCIAFFFLWLFKWKHASDLQNASVPIMISLALITLYVAYFMHEHRERLAVLEKR